MSDENTSDFPAENSSDSPSEPVEATSSVASVEGKTPDAPPKTADTATVNAAASVAPASPKIIPKTTPPASPSMGKESRVEPRIRVKWRVDAFIDGQGVYQGFVKDISLNGTDIFLGHNLQKVKFVKLRIYVPPLSKTSAPHVMDVSANVRYTAYDSREALFHTGVKFSQFNLESDQAYLQSRIATINRVM
jgi:hypothetical protein